MIEDIVFDIIKYFEIQMEIEEDITYPMVIIFGDIGSSDIIEIEKVSIF